MVYGGYSYGYWHKKTTNITGGALLVGDDKNTGNDSKVAVKQSLLSWLDNITRSILDG